MAFLFGSSNPGGDIEIVCLGLRPGEKLYEELLIDAESQPTSHPLIYGAEERALPPDQLWLSIEALEAAIMTQDLQLRARALAVIGVSGKGSIVEVF